jgi:hypothetical protein
MSHAAQFIGATCEIAETFIEARVARQEADHAGDPVALAAAQAAESAALKDLTEACAYIAQSVSRRFTELQDRIALTEATEQVHDTCRHSWGPTGKEDAETAVAGLRAFAAQAGA